ncbi:MAG: cytochrome P450, partial [Pseudomonadota bacterium]
LPGGVVEYHYLDLQLENDLFDGALSPLVRDSVFNSHGDRWRHQRALIEPAFAHMHVRRAFEAMSAACDDAETRLDAAAAAGRPVALDAAMSRVTADVVFRALFSESLESDAARDIFEAFAEYQATVAQISPARLILGRPFATPPAPEACRAACERIRARLRDWIAERLEAPAREDIVGALIAARHPQTGARFDLEELVDQIGVFFLAGHETTAGALTWALFMLSQDPAPAERLRAETHDAAGDGTVTLDHVKRLNRARAAFREAMRLYPPLPFLPRIALEATRIAGARVPRGAMIMIAPWTLHRCEDLWPASDRFDPDRFLPERERGIEKGAYLPFGLGPRLCVGAAFATIEATMILARLMRRYDWRAQAPERVRPLVRLTLRPAEPILMRLRRRS